MFKHCFVANRYRYFVFDINNVRLVRGYLAVKFDIPDVDTSKYTIQVGLIGGDHGAVTLDSDGIVIFRIKNTYQKVEAVATADGLPTVTKVY